MITGSVVLFFMCIIKTVLLQGTGSGTNGNLRLCVVEGRGAYRLSSKYCPVLDKENSGVECVLGTDRLDCLRRISKGTVDFGVFNPEDLVAAQWAKIDVLVTNELRTRARPFERSIVAVVNKRILTDDSTMLQTILRNRTLCHPGTDVNDLRPISDTLSGFLEFQVLPRSCDPELSMAENRVKSLADFFASSCKAGPWVVDKARDAELKRQYPSLCSACGSTSCNNQDRYWGDTGALACLVEVGDVTWGELDDVRKYFGITSSTDKTTFPPAEDFRLLCRDGSNQAIANATEDCVWLHRPWPVIVSKRKAAEAVAKLTSSLADKTVVVQGHWHGALAALLQVRTEQPQPLQPAAAPADYLARAKGFREAYSQAGCNPPRHITLCTTSLLANNKCEWLSEAASVYGVSPPIQCSVRNNTEECAAAVMDGDAHALHGHSDWLVRGTRDFNLTAILHEATPVVENTHTVVAYVLSTSAIENLSELRGKRAAFPSYDGVAWHSVLGYIRKNNQIKCKDVNSYFAEICAPGFEKLNYSNTEVFTKNCYKENGEVLSGEVQALRSVVEGRSDVAFISIETYNKYSAKLIMEPWASEPKKLKPVCPEENEKYCFISWSNLGHIFVPSNLTHMRKQEIINVFTRFDQLFGKGYPFHYAMFSLYGPYNHQRDVLFHNNTKNLIAESMLYSNPYIRIPLSFERTLSNSTDSCQHHDFINFGAKSQPQFLILMFTLVAYLVR